MKYFHSIQCHGHSSVVQFVMDNKIQKEDISGITLQENVSSERSPIFWLFYWSNEPNDSNYSF